jgi:sugar/nucleoside kinase (ribokinase family)
METTAALATPDGEPINPTGAGNAYAAALTACGGTGISPIEAACIASAIGAVFVEYEHLPPWNAQVLSRIRQAVDDVRNKMRVGNALRS